MFTLQLSHWMANQKLFSDGKYKHEYKMFVNFHENEFYENKNFSSKYTS